MTKRKKRIRHPAPFISSKDEEVVNKVGQQIVITSFINNSVTVD
jgi:hypothetical protein